MSANIENHTINEVYRTYEHDVCVPCENSKLCVKCEEITQTIFEIKRDSKDILLNMVDTMSEDGTLNIEGVMRIIKYSNDIKVLNNMLLLKRTTTYKNEK